MLCGAWRLLLHIRRLPPLFFSSAGLVTWLFQDARLHHDGRWQDLCVCRPVTVCPCLCSTYVCIYVCVCVWCVCVAHSRSWPRSAADHPGLPPNNDGNMSWSLGDREYVNNGDKVGCTSDYFKYPGRTGQSVRKAHCLPLCFHYNSCLKQCLSVRSTGHLSGQQPVGHLELH